jgi:4,5-DOPA dioxygenase extradiol
MTHGLPYIEMRDPAAPPPGWSAEFDAWAAEALHRGDVDALLDFERKAPAGRLAHPRSDHFAPLFVSLGAALDELNTNRTVIDGFWFGMAKRSIQIG